MRYSFGFSAINMPYVIHGNVLPNIYAQKHYLTAKGLIKDLKNYVSR
jgi:hypothetical protein